MQLFVLREDGSDLRQITSEDGTHWVSYLAPDGIHAVYVRVPAPRSFELYLLNSKTGAERRLTDDADFDGCPSISPDGGLPAFSSNRGANRARGAWVRRKGKPEAGRRKSADAGMTAECPRPRVVSKQMRLRTSHN